MINWVQITNFQLFFDQSNFFLILQEFAFVNYASRRDRRKGGFIDFYFDDDENGEVDYTKQYSSREDSLFVSSSRHFT